MVFLGQAFTIMLVYVWSRRNPYIRMNFFGVLSFNAPYLPWVLLLFSLLLGNNAIVDFMGASFIYFCIEYMDRDYDCDIFVVKGVRSGLADEGEVTLLVLGYNDPDINCL